MRWSNSAHYTSRMPMNVGSREKGDTIRSNCKPAVASLTQLSADQWIPGRPEAKGQGGARRSLKTIPTRLCLSNYYLPPQIFRPSDMPLTHPMQNVVSYKYVNQQKMRDFLAHHSPNVFWLWYWPKRGNVCALISVFALPL